MEVNKIYQGNCLEVIKTFEDESVDCCITSPPYWGLRDYQTGTWEGGDPNCSHKRDSKYSTKTITGHFNTDLVVGDAIYKSVCSKCGAVRKDEQLGLEETPEEYVEHMVQLFREVKRILKPTGTLWLNLGDSYYGSGKGQTKNGCSDPKHPKLDGMVLPVNKSHDELKSKDLVGIPWMVAFALRKDGWYLRQDIVWSKPNPMPESVNDRCTKSHEYIFLLSKNSNYYFNNDAIKEKATTEENRPFGVVRNRLFNYDSKENNNPEVYKKSCVGGKKYSEVEFNPQSGNEYMPDGYRNKRSVWNVNVKGFKEAHFATYPEDLIEPMIKAGCPEKVCSKCGKPVEIEIVKEPIPEECKTYLDGHPGDLKSCGSMIGWVTNSKYSEWNRTRKVEKIEVKCECGAPFVNGLVYDPFMGAGTTGVVAKRLKRNYIGTELNPEYIKIAEKRIKDTNDKFLF